MFQFKVKTKADATAKKQEKQANGAWTNSEEKIEKAVFDVSDDMEIDRKLRVPRSEIYMQLFDVADILDATDEEIIEKVKRNLDEETANELLEMSPEELREEIRLSFIEEFKSLQININTVLYGVLSHCYIDGCDCHAISPQGEILEHYCVDEPVPVNLQKGRRLLKQYGLECKCVEVYNHCCRVVLQDSSVVTIEDE